MNGTIRIKLSKKETKTANKYVAITIIITDIVLILIIDASFKRYRLKDNNRLPFK
jgi:hypothetical protein